MVDVLMVTYGNRWNFLREVTQRLLQMVEVGRIIIVDNHSSYSVKDSFVKVPSTVTILRSELNEGSAGGFKRGLEYILANPHGEFILLLDDDNLPDMNVLSVLIDEHNLIAKKQNGFALLAYRISRAYLTRSIQGVRPDLIYPVPNSFLGFHVFRLPAQFIAKIFPRKSEQKDIVRIPFAPYGGLFFKSDLLTELGLPDERYFVYGDDFEYTYRITKRGGDIYLVRNAVIRDLEESWMVRDKGKFNSRLLSQQDFKSYLSARNSAHFSYFKLTRNRFIFQLNRILYMSYLFIIALCMGKLRQYRSVASAVRDGLHNTFDNSQFSEG